MTLVCNLWVKWIASRIDQIDKSQINRNGNDNQPHSIQQSTIRPNAPIIIIRPKAAEVEGLKIDVGR